MEDVSNPSHSTALVPDVRIEDLHPFVAPDVRLTEFRNYRTEVVRKTGKVREWTESLAGVILFVILFTTFVAQATQVPTPSMVPTIRVGDHFFLDKVAFPGNFPPFLQKWLPRREIRHRDIIAFHPPPSAGSKMPFVKRVIGLPGDTVEVKDRTVYLNGVAQDEPYKIHVSSGGGDYGPKTVPPDQFFVMGDNRDDSLDSRFWGFADRNSIIGKPLFVYWSFERNINEPYMTETSWASRVVDYLTVVRHFITRTRWFRFGTIVR